MTKERAEKNRLNKLIREKNDQIKSLDDLISTKEKSVSDINQINTTLSGLKKEKLELEVFFDTSKSKKEGLETDITILELNKAEINKFIDENQPVKDTLIETLTNTRTENTELSESVSNFRRNKSILENEIRDLTEERNTIDRLMIELREKFGLYSKDMKDMSLDSKKQLKTYSISAIFSMSLAIALMTLLLIILTGKTPFPEKLTDLFTNEPTLMFYSILIMRVSISGVFIFLIVILLNLTRGFISQYIKSRNKLSSLRIVDFLIGRIHVKKNSFEDQDTALELEQEKLKEQVALLNIHIPKFMEVSESTFNKESNPKGTLELLKEIKSIVSDK